MKFIIGIDEVGRGPLAGPVTVGIFVTDQKNQNKILKNIFNNKLRDSKKLSEKNRKEICKKLLILKNEGKVIFSVAHVSNKIIDKKGISYGINFAIKRLLVNTKRSASNIDFFNKNCVIKLDGSLKAPKEYANQKTIIKGDEKEVCIACASIIAKVKRDALMASLGSKYPLYAFQIHKGYGTKLHRDLIKKHGFSLIHRLSFCKKI